MDKVEELSKKDSEFLENQNLYTMVASINAESKWFHSLLRQALENPCPCLENQFNEREN